MYITNAQESSFARFNSTARTTIITILASGFKKVGSFEGESLTTIIQALKFDNVRVRDVALNALVSIYRDKTVEKPLPANFDNAIKALCQVLKKEKDNEFRTYGIDLLRSLQEDQLIKGSALKEEVRKIIQETRLTQQETRLTQGNYREPSEDFEETQTPSPWTDGDRWFYQKWSGETPLQAERLNDPDCEPNIGSW